MSTSKNTFGVALAALVGAAAGVVAGILIAPRSGVETREKVAQAAGRTADQLVDSLGASVTVTCDDASQVAQEVGEKTDELREKVAAARARMNQVRADIAKGAEQAAQAHDAGDAPAAIPANEAPKAE